MGTSAILARFVTTKSWNSGAKYCLINLLRALVSIKGSVLVIVSAPSCRLVPFAAQPVHDQPQRGRVENLIAAECRHPVVAFAVEPFVLRIGDDANEPFARAVAGEVRPAGILARLAELMTFGAAHGVAREERPALGDGRGVALVGLAL